MPKFISFTIWPFLRVVSAVGISRQDLAATIQKPRVNPINRRLENTAPCSLSRGS